MEDAGQAIKPIVPTPVSYIPTGQGSIRLDTGDWVVIYKSDDVMNEAQYLAGRWLAIVPVDFKSKLSSTYMCTV